VTHYTDAQRERWRGWWHGHNFARGDRPAKTNQAYWSAKIGRNVARDARHLAALRADGWKVLTVWECDLRKPTLERRLRKFLDARSA
jgi:DNA mismatch endonuclease, patch repair protein